MRFPGSKIYRAFPELDRFSDQRCAKFVHAASWNGAWFLARWLGLAMVFVVSLVSWVYIMIALSGMLNLERSGGLNDERWWLLVAAAYMTVAILVPALLTLFVRDILLRRRIRLFIADRGTCECGYLLLGLPVSANLVVVCPECGADKKVDVAMGELVTQEGGARTFKPAEGGL